MRSIAATWWSIRSFTRRPSASMRACGSCPTNPGRSANGFRPGCTMARSEVGARVVLLEGEQLLPGHTADVQLVLSRPIAAAALDRFVLRDVSAQRTMGGGQFLDLRAPSRQRRTAERGAQRAALAIADPQLAFAALLDAQPFAWDISAFARDRALSGARQDRDRRRAHPGRLPQRRGAHRDRPGALANLRRRPARMSLQVPCELSGSARHGQGETAAGIAAEACLPLPSRWRCCMRMFPVAWCATVPSYVWPAIPCNSARNARRPGSGSPRYWVATFVFARHASATSPGVLARPEQDIRELLKFVARLGLVDEVAHDHFFLRPTMHEMVLIAADIAAHAADGRFTAAQFRDRLGGRSKSRHTDTGVLRPARRYAQARHLAQNPATLPRLVRIRPRFELHPQEEHRPRWGVRTSNPGEADKTVSGGFDSHALPPRRWRLVRRPQCPACPPCHRTDDARARITRRLDRRADRCRPVRLARNQQATGCLRIGQQGTSPFGQASGQGDVIAVTVPVSI